MLNVVMLSVIILSVVILTVVMASVTRRLEYPFGEEHSSFFYKIVIFTKCFVKLTQSLPSEEY
jgi:hypothetical protein